MTSQAFLNLPPCGFDAADVLLLPIPMEMTVSYGQGTAGGPAAILAATSQIELFDEETGVDFTVGPKVHTLPPLVLAGGVEEVLATIRHALAELRRTAPEKFPLILGGEHLLSYGTVRGLVDDPAQTTIVHIDAHADLADTLHDQRWSHGTVMRRLWEDGCRLVQIGIRSVSRPEYELTQCQPRITTFYAHEFAKRWPEVLETLQNLTGDVYLSLDVDGLDPSIVPSTGTPQPNGLSWPQTMEILASLAAARGCRWVGADLVEFVPSPIPPGCDPTAARLLTKLLAFWWKGQGKGM